ncbi:TPA: ABC transporter ATP-binding protein [Burkholderia multivorans]|uniref:ABC transporter ATP-binding protein n=1 Tax=Burkholderia multivorans TaxID=87883 RepID=UPI002019C392|nr:ABC transporter ATP-binding protein [Burkholderia multivorans]MCO1459901.1 ABC transporter ATP-binding protein [Burkholderia multivorans]UQO21312.1 ABC transporter ATP-binding protein [Burkholderia multivorans]HEM7842903.1 ABC transporter ATP-binding protein [Burkholderia multivorans]HEM7908288.1 ABC transporter ATP-binding protein [Burkholderia multivorans]HEM8539413.1 ABC transporter ATP-binding protein [Burkholderia multivorans]
MPPRVLDVRDLSVEIRSPSGTIRPVDGVSFSVSAGRTLALVGESGSGKSLTCLSLLRALPADARISSGNANFEGLDLLKLSDDDMQALRGRRIGTVLQDPHASLDPLFTVGEQIREIIAFQRRSGRTESRHQSIDAMREVHIPAPEQRFGTYPHQFSGGMKQRAAIAMAISCGPALLIADEPTTALDVTIRQQILRLLAELQSHNGMAMLFVTHDLHLVRYFCDEVAVMYAGRIVEQGPVERVFAAPAHPYTASLINAIPQLRHRRARLTAIDGQPPSFHALPAGCRFAPRCPLTDTRCENRYPEWTDFEHHTRGAACWRATELLDAKVKIA